MVAIEADAVLLERKLREDWPNFPKRAEVCQWLHTEGLRTEADWLVLDERLIEVVLSELRASVVLY